jgi:hypothetical protein
MENIGYTCRDNTTRGKRLSLKQQIALSPGVGDRAFYIFGFNGSHFIEAE